MPNSYSNLGFRLELDRNNWSSSFGIHEDNVDTLSALLHEYIHYLQDTCTYYGALYRREAYDEDINRDIKVLHQMKSVTLSLKQFVILLDVLHTGLV